MFDITMDTQRVFRNLLESISYPGRKINIYSDENYGVELFDTTIEVALTLLDGEVTFFIEGNLKKSEEEIFIRTNSKVSNREDADFIIIPLREKIDFKNYLDEENNPLIKVGSLIDPQYSATFIVEVEKLNEGDELEITGPGIENSKSISGIGTKEILDLRDKLCDFPIGVDIFFIDREKNVMAIPRSTKIKG